MFEGQRLTAIVLCVPLLRGTAQDLDSRSGVRMNKSPCIQFQSGLEPVGMASHDRVRRMKCILPSSFSALNERASLPKPWKGRAGLCSLPQKGGGGAVGWR